MRRFRRWPFSRRSATPHCVPQLEALEDRTLPAAVTLFGQFQNALGLLSLHGDSASHVVSASISANGFVQVSIGNQLASSDPHSAAYDPALAGATGQTIQAIQLNGSAGLDQLVLGNLSVAGGLSVETDGVLDVQGQVSAAGPIQLSGQSVLLPGQVRADGSIGGAITVKAGNVLQSGLLEANGSQGAGGTITVDFTGQYLATVSSMTSANSTGGSGGLVEIDGGSTGTLFSSGQYQANALHNGSGGDIELFGQQVQLVGATINASGYNGGGWVRVGGDSPSDIAAHGGDSAGLSYAATTTVDATTTLTANATGAGNGGPIVVWSQQTTTFGGTLAAQGAGQGTGGLLEVSSAGLLTYGGHAVATASSGKQGRLLLDPKDLTISSAVGFPQFNLLNPKPDVQDTFGNSVAVLTNGNVAIADPNSGLVSLNAGAVFLYDGVSGALLGTLTGSTSFDEVGSGGVIALSNGNFVVSSPSWQDNGASVGAATWVSGTGGPVAAVSEANSLFGSSGGDEVGFIVTALPTNGNYVVASPFWQDAGAAVGAVTWADGTNGTVGAVSASNSLVGSTAGDEVGIGNGNGVTPLTNGNYVVDSPDWQNPNGSDGAATWGNGMGGTIGPVSAANSLVGAFSFSGTVGGSVTALSDGNYVVSSSGWNPDNTFADADLGAATWGDGSTGLVGVVSASNSLVGATGFDAVSSGGVTALSNGNYVVISPDWQDNGLVGAVTWGQAGGGTVGPVTAANSLIGSTDGDNVGVGGVTLLSNGDYVVSSPNWQIGGNDVGAVTWAAADGSTVGPVTASNSLVGSTGGDSVGFGNGNPGSGVTALTNGDYVVSSPNWQNVGAVTWAAADGSTVGPVSTSNSLIGSTPGDQVGVGGVTALSNGNYVVSSPDWQNGAADVGAVTFSQADGSTLGPVTAANSFIGATNGDQVGSGGVVALASGAYLISSPNWQQGGVTLSAATWVNGLTGLAADSADSVDSLNSLIGPGGGAQLAQLIGLSGGKAFLATFTGNGGTVTLVQIAAQTEAYATAATQDLSLAPSFLAATLDTGTAVVLQASNDITVNSPIVVSNPLGNGGDLTLQAGRSIIINANITTDNGNLTLIANDTAADGVVDSQRTPGAASVSMAAGTALDAGTGHVTITVSTGAGNTNSARGDLMANLVGGSVTFNDPGQNVTIEATGNLTLISSTTAGTLTASAGGTLSSSGPLAVSGAASLTGSSITLTNAQNTFQGSVALSSSGSIALTDSSPLTVGSATPLGGVNLNGSTTLSAPSIGFLSALNVGAQTLTLTSNTGATLNSDTTIAGGTISDSSGLIVGSGATLAGTGVLQVGSGLAGVLVQPSGTLAPGLSPSGLTVNGDLTFSSGSILSEQIEGNTQFGLLNANGAIALGDATLQLAFVNLYQPAAFDSYQVVNNGPGNTITGTFAQGSTFNLGTNTLTVNYASGANNVLLIVQGAAASVTPLPSTSPASFNVSWSGHEYAQGASTYDVYVAEDTGPFTLWQTDTTLTSANYAGQFGHTYRFYSVYTDDAANQLPSAQASTTVGTTFATPASENENTTLPTVVTVTTVLGTHYSDPDGVAFTKPGIAVFQTSGAGAWQYSTNGTTWVAIANVSQTQALLLPGADRLRFVPAANSSGQANLTFVAWDGSQGTAGATASIAVSGGLTPFSTSAGALAMTVNPVPRWVGTGAALTSLSPNPTTPAGNTIASVFTSYFQDNNLNVPVGVAINSVTGTTSGTWQFMLSGGSTWTNFPAVSTTAALLLSANDLIRFVPKTTFVGTVALKALAWDGSVGIDGETANPAKLASSAFSTTLLTATASVNRSPTLSTATFVQGSVAQYATSAAATVASLLVKAGYADPDGKALPQGIAVVAAVANSGTYQYMLAGGTWQALPSVSVLSALLLPSTASLRLVAGKLVGSATLTFQGWDETQGVAGQTFAISSPGNPSAFSTAQTKESYNVTTSTNHAPTLSNQSFSEPTVIVTTAGAAITVTSLLTQAGYADQDSKALHGLALFGVTGGVGVVQYLLPGGTWQPAPSVSALSALLLPSTASLRLVAGSQSGAATLQFFGWDQTQGAAGQLFSIGANLGGATAFSLSPLAVTIPVANNAPTLATHSFALPVINENANSPAVTAATLLTKAVYADANGKTLPSGIAITGDSGPGAWQWLDGTTWTALPSVSSASAFLLPSTAQVRFQPDDSLATNTNGSATLTYLGWNETVGAADTSFTLPSPGSASAFSSTSATASMPVDFVKPTAVWLAGATAKFSPVLGFSATNTTPQPAGDTVGSVFASAFRDAPGINVGVAISAQTGTAYGSWQYSTNGGQSWVAFPTTVSPTAALLLHSTDMIRFVPKKAFSGTVSLTAYAWDGTGVFATNIANVTKTGTGVGHPFSPTTLAASCLVNTAPTLS